MFLAAFCSPRRKQTPPPTVVLTAAPLTPNPWWHVVNYEKQITTLPFTGDDGEEHWYRTRRDIFTLSLPTAPNRHTVIAAYKHKKQLRFSVTNSYGSKRVFSKTEFAKFARGIYGNKIITAINAKLKAK